MASLVGATTINKDQTAQNLILKGNVSYDITLAWDEPAASRTITINDPGANDAFVFLAAGQTLTNKTIDAASNTISNIGASEVTTGLITGQVEDTTPDSAADYVLTYDASAGVLKKVLLDNLPSAGGANSLSDLTDTTITTPSAGQLLIYDGVDSWDNKAMSGDATIDANGVLSLETDAVDAITEIAASLRTGADPTLVTGTVGTNGNLIQWNVDGDAVDSNIAATNVSLLDTAQTYTGSKTYNPGTTPSDAIKLDIDAPTTAGTRDSHKLIITGASYDTAGHKIDWQLYVGPTSNAGASTFHIQSRIDAAAFADRLTITDAGDVVIPGNLTVNGTTTTISSTTLEVADKSIRTNVGGTTAGATDAGLEVEGDGAATIGALRFLDSAATKFTIGDGTTQYEVVGTSATQTLTNKTIDTASNTLTIAETDIIDGTILARVADAETITGQWIFNNFGKLTQANGLASGNDVQLGDLGTATSTVTGYDSQALILKGSTWSASASAAQDTDFRILFNAASETSFQLLFQKKVGAGSVVNIAALDQDGNLKIAGTLEEAATISTL